MKQIFHKNIGKTNHIHVWKVTSTSSELYKNSFLSQKELVEFSALNNEKRKVEFIALRIGLKTLFNNTIELKHHKSGRPYIKEAQHISISHSNKYIAIAFGEENIGIDIEKPQEKILKLIPRVLSKKELQYFQTTPSTELACKLWGTKESILKYIGDKNLNYRDDIQIETIESNKAKYLDQVFKIAFEQVEEMILTYVMKKM